MSTALDIITDALNDLGAVDPSESLTADEAAHGLRRLNAMLGSWSNENLACYTTLQENFALSSGVASYTIGSGATFNTTRPLNILGGFIRNSSIDYPLQIISREEYDRITSKTTQGLPEYLFYSPSVANGVIYLHAIPDAAYVLYIDSTKQLQNFALLTTAVVLPEGYTRALIANLALELAPAYNRKVPEAVLAIARESKAAIKRLNSRTPKLRLDHLGGSAASGMAAFNAGY
jgi:hypothetical protein